MFIGIPLTKEDYQYKSEFAAFCNDEDVADAMFEAISHRPWCYFDFLEFLEVSPLDQDLNYIYFVLHLQGSCKFFFHLSLFNI